MPSQFIRSFAILVFLGCWARAATIQIIPVRSTEPFELSQNTIAISQGAQRLLFEMTISDWGPGGLHVFQVGLDATLSTPDASLPALAVEPCSDASMCAQAFGSAPSCVSLCVRGERAHRICETQAGCPQGACTGQCEPVSVDTSRPDFVFAGRSTLSAVSYAGAVVFGAVPLSGTDPIDSGTPRYIATLVVDVPDGWLGTQTLGFNDDPNSTFVAVGTSESSVPLTLVPARIVIRCNADADCEDDDPCTSGTCDTSVHHCPFTPTFDDALFCCDRETGELQPIEDDGNECTIDRCASGHPVHAFVPPGTDCGDKSSTLCTFPDTCSGFGLCQSNHRSAGTVCGPTPTSVCDRAPSCDGLGNCVERFAPAFTPCGVSGPATACGGDFCDGAGNCTQQFAPLGTRCGTAQAYSCERDSECDGAGHCVHLSRPAGTLCANGGGCELGTCDGSGSCRTVSFGAAGTACSPVNPCERGVCDGHGLCNATSFAGALTVCLSADRCKVGTCDGHGTCQTTRFTAPGTACIPANPCETGECDGTGTCQVTSFAPTGTGCGTGVNTTCNLRDTCDGLGHCQANPAPAGTVCGSHANTICNRPDTCDGSGACLSNNAPAGTSCGTPAVCEQARTCDGNGACRTSFLDAGTPCGSSVSTECDQPDSCDGAGHCLTNLPPTGTPCGSHTETTCDHADTCDGLGSCHLNRAPDGTVCEDDLYCNGVEECLHGVCVAGRLPCVSNSCHESTRTCDPPDPTYDVFPPDQSTLWREAGNEIRLRPRLSSLPANRPAPGEMLIQEMLPGGLYGPDLSANFSFTLVNPGLFGGPELLIREETRSLQHRKWYALRAPDGWPVGTPPILFEFAVQVGDATGDGFVVTNDLAAVNARVPTVHVDARSIRMDITGDGKINMADVAATYRKIPSTRLLRPGGH